jgi:hypothetical protein
MHTPHPKKSACVTCFVFYFFVKSDLFFEKSFVVRSEKCASGGDQI